ncbi:hypothetical protein [Herbiconiux sp. YIM B11900]|uniref:hypothetical protein n=1 Tax=Herbiconiux sp. YIM B11900 TaxID=3404131 RepID=UPI003F843238
MSELSDRIDEPGEADDFARTADDLESVDPEGAEDIDALEDEEGVDEKVDPVFDDDEEVLHDNLGYEE